MAEAETQTKPQTLPALEGTPLPAMSEQGFLPSDEELRRAQRYASGLVLAGIVPDAFKFNRDVLGPPGSTEPLHRKGDINQPLVLMGVLKCIEINVAPQTGLGGLLPLNGRFTVWGDLAAGLVQRGGQVTNHTVQRIGPAFDPETPVGNWPPEYGYEVRYWRKGQEEPYIGRFTVRDAKRAGLWMNSSKDPWVKYPDRMLFNRARAFVMRDGFADALMGLEIAEEVMDWMPTAEEEERLETRLISKLTDDEPETAPQGAQEDPATSEPREPETASEGAAGPADGENAGNSLL